MTRLVVELDAQQENARGRLRLVHAPGWRRLFIVVTGAFTLLGLVAAFLVNDATGSRAVAMAVVAVAVPLLVWFGFSNQYSWVFSVADINHQVLGNRRRFAYELADGALTESCEGTDKRYPLADLRRVNRRIDHCLLAFGFDVVYLPFAAASRAEVEQLVDAVESDVANTASRGECQS